MFRFFRQIRQRLFPIAIGTENPSGRGGKAGRFKKPSSPAGRYLLYAIGEIVLVVIGILIALQINTWNEDRKRQKLKASYTASLISDLSLDTLMLGKLINENSQTLESLVMQQKRFLGPETHIDTLIKIVRNEFDPELNTRFQYHRNTLNTLIASGNIDLFTQEFNEKLMALISMQDLERENSIYYLNVYSSKVSRFSDDFPVSRRQNSNLINSIWTDVDQRKLASGFISLTDIKGFAHYTFARQIEKIKEETTMVLEYLASTP